MIGGELEFVGNGDGFWACSVRVGRGRKGQQDKTSFKKLRRGEKGTEPEGRGGRKELTYRKRDDTLGIYEPAAPPLLVDADAVDAFDRGLMQRIRGRELDGDLHRLVVDFVAGGDLFGFGVYFDDERLRVGVLCWDPFFDGYELGGDDGRGYLLIVSQCD